MRETGFLYILGLVLLTTFSVVVESGLLITSPRIVHSGSTHKLAVSLVAVNKSWEVIATIRNRWGDIISTAEDEFASDIDGTLNLEIPRNLKTGGKTELRVKLSVTGGPKGGKHVFQKSERITLKIAKKTIFIQTDKPIYKPGQLIRMRIVGVDETLRPLKGKVSRVSIINPSGVRIMQWDNIDLTVGIASLNFSLSSQPVLGNWKIAASIKGVKKTQVVGVEKYVLPKFKVTIDPPSFVALDTEDVTATICAQYTYGQPVAGKVKVLFNLKTRYHYWRNTRNIKVTDEKEINGCTDVTISRAALRLSEIRHYYRPLLAINATVTEKATGVAQNATGTETVVETYSAKLEFLPTTPNTFKLGMPFRGQLKATKQDGSPLSGEEVIIVVSGRKILGRYWYRYDTSELLRQNFSVPVTGVVDFVVPGSVLPISSQYKTLYLTAQQKRGSVRANQYAQLWYSPSNSYIDVEGITAPVKVGSVAKIKFSFTADNATDSIHFHYQVVSRGKLVIHGSEWQKIEKGYQSIKTGAIEFNVIQGMVPSCRLLLFYVRDDGETVAANMVLDVEDALENEVSVRFADDTRKPGEATKLIISAAPGSKVAITAVDKSVHLLRRGNELTEDDAISVLSGQDVGPSGNFQRPSCNVPYWWRGVRPRKKRSIIPSWQPRDMDATKAFDDTGMIYFSDLKIATSFCPKIGPLASFRRFSRPPEFSRFAVGGAGLESTQEFLPQPDVNQFKKKKKKKENKPRPLNIRKEFPETWLWIEEIVNNKTGKTEIVAKVPDTITSWTASAFGMSNAFGFGVSKAASIRVFQPFFVSLTLPYSVIRGEEVSVITSVFNYMSKCLSIRLDLLDSSDYRIISDNSQKLCVCSKEAKSVAFTILPKNLGRIPLTVVAKNIDSSVCKKDVKQMTLGITDGVSRKLLVEPEGVREEYTYNNFLCLTDESFFKDSIDISLPENVVPGSVHAVVSTVGDIMGPALNVGSMLRLPYGCGEQNMINFAPSIYIMKYLSSVDQLSQSLENKAKQIMTIGYQRELSYKRKDGSYSAFGDYDSQGNMWLTAFVLRSFSQARRFIFVDKNELKTTTAWITKHQRPDGCFPKVGRLFNKRMKGGVSTEVTLTAFVAVSLLEMGMTPKDSVIKGALRCVIDSSSPNTTDSYSTALLAYTLTLAKDPRRSSYFQALQEKAIKEGDLLHWEKEKTQKPVDSRFPWRWYYRAPAADIEMTGYALMTYVLMAEEDGSLIAEAMPIVRWLSKQRNALGGFASTQDTCVALQALGKYASEVYSNSTELSVRFGEENHPRFNQLFTITNNNRLVSQRAEVPSELLPMKALPVEVQGSGCALVQADVSYNIPEVQEEPAFDLDVKVKRVDDVFASPLTTETGEELCGPLEMEISARWLREDSSNMAVIDIKLVSGFQADEESLDRLFSRPELGFKRKEIDGTHVILYFDEIEKVSFSFKIYQSSIVKKTKPASVTVYDYYEPHLTATEMYKIHSELCNPKPVVVPAKCPTCVKDIDYKKMLPTLCKAKKVYDVDVDKNGDAFYKEIPQPKNVTTGVDSKNTSNASDGKENSTSVRFDLNIPAECQCTVVRPGSKLYVFVDGVNLVPIEDNAVFVSRDSVKLRRLWRMLYDQCRRNP